MAAELTLVAGDRLAAGPTQQQRMRDLLAKAGIPYREIQCYGMQIVITTKGEASAKRWAALVAKFARVKRVLRSCDYARENKGTVLRPSMVTVWRVFATIEAPISK